MTPVEFFSGWEGYDEQRKTEWDVQFWISKVNALRTTWSKEQANQIQKDKAFWRGKSNKPTKPLDASKVASFLNMISK